MLELRAQSNPGGLHLNLITFAKTVFPVRSHSQILGGVNLVGGDAIQPSIHPNMSGRAWTPTWPPIFPPWTCPTTPGGPAPLCTPPFTHSFTRPSTVFPSTPALTATPSMVEGYCLLTVGSQRAETKSRTSPMLPRPEPGDTPERRDRFSQTELDG